MDRLRHIVIASLTLALFIGAGWQSCASLSFAASTQHANDHAGHNVSHHDHMAVADIAGAEANKPPQHQHGGDVHACLKCCAACMPGHAASSLPTPTVTEIVSRVAFFVRVEQLRGQIVFVDPDIPKPVV